MKTLGSRNSLQFQQEAIDPKKKHSKVLIVPCHCIKDIDLVFHRVQDFPKLLVAVFTFNHADQKKYCNLNLDYLCLQLRGLV